MIFKCYFFPENKTKQNRKGFHKHKIKSIAYSITMNGEEMVRKMYGVREIEEICNLFNNSNT